jgi:hypothetical protein
MEAWNASVNFEKLIIEIGHYGLESMVVDRHLDPFQLNLLGNKLVMEALAKRMQIKWMAQQH